MAKLERCNALGLRVKTGSLPPPTTSTSSTVQAAPAAPRPKGAARARRTNRAPKKSADEIMAEANAEAAAMGLPPRFVRSTVTVTALTAAEEKAWDDEQAAAKAARKAVRDEKRRR